MKIFGIVNEEKFKGYANSVKSLLNEVKDENAKELIDVNNFSVKEIQKQIKSSAKNEKTMVLSAGNMGTEIFETLSNQDTKSTLNVEHILASDRYYHLDMKKINSLSLVMPQNAINEYKNDAQKYPQTAIDEYPADLVASPTKEDMINRASDFESLNPTLTQKVKDMIHKDGVDVFFVGGRVALPDGTFKENTPEIFARTAYDIAQKAKDGAVIVFHGLRSFTRGDKKIDLEPYTAFLQTLKKYMPANKEFMLITKALSKSWNNNNSSLVSYANLLKRPQKPNAPFEETYNFENAKDIMYTITPSKFGAAEYYFVLNEAVKAKLPLYATIEQMNFIPEALTLGAKPTDFIPYQWKLSVDSNVQTYDKLFLEYEKNNKLLDTQVSAFKKLLSNITQNEIAVNKSTQNVDTLKKILKEKTK